MIFAYARGPFISPEEFGLATALFVAVVGGVDAHLFACLVAAHGWGNVGFDIALIRVVDIGCFRLLSVTRIGDSTFAFSGAATRARGNAVVLGKDGGRLVLGVYGVLLDARILHFPIRLTLADSVASGGRGHVGGARLRLGCGGAKYDGQKGYQEDDDAHFGSG